MTYWDDDKPVGYRKPPSWGQFRKGESGNPKGRPKKRRDAASTIAPASGLDAIVERVTGRKIVMTENGTPKTVTAMEGVINRTTADALKGSSQAQRAIIRLHRQAEEGKAQRAAMAAETAERERQDREEIAERAFHYICELKRSQTLAWDRARSMGLDEPDNPWPHPDDMFVDEARRIWRVRGPLDASEQQDWERLRDIRDYFIARMTLSAVRREPAANCKMWAGLALRDDVGLPLRWQMRSRIDPAGRPYLWMSRQELEQLVAEQERGFALFASGQRRAREHYEHINALLGPALSRLGYRSLKHFERAYVEAG